MSDTIECGTCNKSFKPKSHRAKFCSESCKQKNKRTKEGAVYVPEVELDDEVVPVATFDGDWWAEDYDEPPLKGIDTHFAKRRMELNLPPAKFTEEREAKCPCGNGFVTRLRLMRYCSVKCLDKAR